MEGWFLSFLRFVRGFESGLEERGRGISYFRGRRAATCPWNFAWTKVKYGSSRGKRRVEDD